MMTHRLVAFVPTLPVDPNCLSVDPTYYMMPSLVEWMV